MLHTIADGIWRNQNKEISRFTKIIFHEYSEIKKWIEEKDEYRFRNLVQELSNGSFLVMKNAFSKDEVEFLKRKGMKLIESTPSTFYKMDAMIPNFWRDITEEHSHKYGVPVVKQSMYFFHWNGEEDLFRMINQRWNIFKLLGGRDEKFGRNTTPKDGYIDRIQLVKYPGGSGYLSAHQDPTHNQRLFISGYLSKIGKDFNAGGFWALSEDNRRKNLESYLNPGDMGCGYANIIHGVDKIDDDKNSERWFLGLYTNDSDLVEKRKTLKVPSSQKSH
jgi:hypothetical protein